uniref:Uncharacterized protein n=1 Tax=Romanomermis culicivorax TaxID=13658 RepID=A0A915KRF6_ROMCU
MLDEKVFSEANAADSNFLYLLDECSAMWRWCHNMKQVENNNCTEIDMIVEKFFLTTIPYGGTKRNDMTERKRKKEKFSFHWLEVTVGHFLENCSYRFR